jgi:activator of HSP90 ATPase
MSIHRKIKINCRADDVFEALTVEKRFAEFSGAPASIDAKPGGVFSCFDDMISGMTIEILPVKRLVQAWRVFNWESGIYSIAKFELEPISDSETMLVFDHTGFPEEHHEHLDPGWHEKYWNPMKMLLEKE